MINNEENNEQNKNKKDSSPDFLEQFFKYNDLFSPSSKPETQKQEEKNTKIESTPKFPSLPENFTKKITKISTSQKDINLKKLFQSIETEKTKHQKRIQKKINSPQEKQKYIPTVEMIHLQSEFRLLFEDFLKILPLIEKSARLQEIEERYSRDSRSEREYFPELWENEGSIIFKKIHEIKSISDENIFENKIIAQNKAEKLAEQELEKEAELLKIKQIEEQEQRLRAEEEINNKIFLKEQKKREQEIQQANQLHQEELLQKKKKEQDYANQKRAQEKRASEKKHQEQLQKIRDIKNSFTQFSQETAQKTQDVFAAAGKKIIQHSEILSSKISEFSPQKEIFTGKQEQNSQKIKKLARLRSLKREKKIQETKKESGILEGIKIMSMVALLFIISMIGLNSGSILEVTEKYWNAKEYAEKQESTSKLVHQSDQSAKNTFANIPSLPVAGPETKTEKGFDTKIYLNISPPDTRIIIPKLGKNIPILTVENEAREQEDWNKLEKDIQDALKDGVVHYPGTANPGQLGNVFITGHSSYYPWDDGKYKDVFAALHDLEEGDEYFIFHKGKKYRYIITTRKIVDPSDVSVLEQDTSKKTSTLMTCTPIGTTARRLILQAEEAGVSY